MSHIGKCMDRILEGIDTGNAKLISEAASEEFKGAFNKLKDSIEKTAGLVNDANIAGLQEPYAKLMAQIAEAEKGLDEVASEWSWADQIELLKKPSEDSPAETMISAIALAHDANVNAVKDAVIVIAEYLEKAGKGLFVVGNQGLEINPKFKELISDEFSLAMFSDDDVMAKLVNVDPKDPAFAEEGEEAVADAVKEKYAELHGGDENKWKELQGTFKSLMDGIKTLHGECGERIKNGKPSKEFQNAAPNDGLMKSILGALFGSSGGSDVDPQKVMGSGPEDPKGLLALPFDGLAALVKGLLELSTEASESATEAITAIDDNQEEIEKGVTSKELRNILMKGYGESPKDPSMPADTGTPKTARAMGAFENMFDKGKDITVEMIEKNVDSVRQRLENPEGEGDVVKLFKFQSDEIDELFEILGLKGGEGEEIQSVELPLRKGGNHKAPMDDFKKFAKKSGVTYKGPKAALKAMWDVMEEEGLVTLRESFGESKAAFKKEFEQKVHKKIDSGNMTTDNKNDAKKVFTPDFLDIIWAYFKSKGVQLNESRLFDRWGVLAGIIKD